MIPRVPKSSGGAASRALASLPALLLLAYGVAFASASIGRRLPVFDDHPGQLYRLWNVVSLGPAPWAWSPFWWTGYPELQFYPPAFAYAGALAHWISRGTLPIEGAYVALLWLAYLVPGFTTLFALARVQRSAWLALPGAFVALTLSLWPALMSGVEGGVRVGMAPARLGWAMLPLLLGVLVPWADGRAPFPARAVVPLAALVVLTHPAHLPAAVVLVLLAALVAPPRGRRLAVALGWLAVAALLTAFWTLPLLARLDQTRALAWGRLAESLPHVRPVIIALLAIMALVAPLAAWASRSGGVWLAALFPWAMALVTALDAFVLEGLGLRWLPADRVMDSVWLGFLLAGFLRFGGIHGVSVPWPGRFWLRRHQDVQWACIAMLVVVGLATVDRTLTLWPRAGEWPAYSETVRGLRMDALWRTLRTAPPGRVLFVRSGVPLVYGPEWWRPHTHLTSLTPRESGREIVNGTFTHPSPIAALLYRGDAGRGAITTLVERLDGVSLFGRPLESLDAATLNGYAQRLRVSTIVALEDDLPRLEALADNEVFRTRRVLSPFVVWLGEPALVPQPSGPGRWRMLVDAPAGAWASTGIAYYPLWRATAIGRSLDTRRGAAGDLEVRAPASGAVELTYGAGAPEIAGLVVTALGVLLWLVAPRYFTAAAPASEHS
jgi:hypothetical protein